MKKEEWLKIDWTKSNHEIAKKTGRAVNTVEKRRVALGFSYIGEKKPRKDKGISTPQPHLNKPEYQALATQRAKQSPKSGRFETNAKAKIWTVKSPDNKTYTFCTLYVHTYIYLSLRMLYGVKKRMALNGVVRQVVLVDWQDNKMHLPIGRGGN